MRTRAERRHLNRTKALRKHVITRVIYSRQDIRIIERLNYEE